MNLTPIEARVLGSLVEKDATTPDYYPLDPAFDVRQAPMARAALDAVRHAPDTRLALAPKGDPR